MIETLPIDEDVTLGIDLGIASCGTALLSSNAQERTLFLGARCFETPEDNKKVLKNKHRREARGQRTVIRRRRQRMTNIRRQLHDHGILQTTDPDAQRRKGAPDPWTCRAEGLSRALDGEEFAVALIHIAKHRGFKSNRKSERAANAPDEDSKMLKGIEDNREKSAKYQTVGEMLFRDQTFKEKKRNRGGDYSHTLPRDLLEAEVGVLFERQRALGNPLASETMQAAYSDIAFAQNPLQDSEDAVGPCPFEPDEKRAAKHCYSFELFRYLARLASLTVRLGDGTSRGLRAEEIAHAAHDFGSQKTITFNKLHKLSGLPKSAVFEGVDAARAKLDLCARNGCAAGTAALRRVLGDAAWRSLLATPNKLDAIAFTLAFREDIDSIRQGLADRLAEPLIVDTVMRGVADGAFADFRGAGHISAKAAGNLVPHLMQGLVYSRACDMAEYDFNRQQEITLDDIGNPVVVRALREGLQQVRTVIREHGRRPGAIHIELARDLGKGAEEREKIERGMRRRESEKERHRQEFMETVGRTTCSNDDLLHYELWKEQEHKCIYTGTYISPGDIAAEGNVVQVDHVLPRSRSQDNSYVNKALCLTTANQEKGNQTPWEWKGETDPDWWREFEARVEALKVKGFKKRNLLMKGFAEREPSFVRRNLNDTRYAARALMAELRKLYPESESPKRRVFARPGNLTSRLRRAWGLGHLKHDGDGNRIPDDRNHALDALICACADEGLLNHVTREYQRLERMGRGNAIPKVDPPWPTFPADAAAAVEAVFVSRSERRRARGKAHEATIRQVREEDGKRIAYERKAIEHLTAKDIYRIKDPESNGAVIEALARWVERGKPKDDPPRSPKGDPIRKVRLRMSEKAGIMIRGGHADNADMVRVDVFRKNGEFYLVPIYTHQVADKGNYPTPPNRAVDAGKPEGAWTAIDDTFDFRFSLHQGSYVEMVKKKGTVIEGYYRSTDRSTGAVTLSPQHRGDDKARIRSIGARTLSNFKKFSVDRLGRKHEVKREKRTWRGAVCT